MTALERRIELLRSEIRMRDVLTHFGHRYRLHGNMLCCWHDESRPSARMYDKEDRYYCWVCAPERGVDVIEFVVHEKGWMDTLPQDLPEAKRHAIATIRAIEYLEKAFGLAYTPAPFADRIQAALRRPSPPLDGDAAWRYNHRLFLATVAQSPHPDRLLVYARCMHRLEALRPTSDPTTLQEAWRTATREVTALVEQRTATAL